MLTDKNDRQESLAEKILQLTADDYTIRITPDYDEFIEVRLTKDNATVARILSPSDYRQSYRWKSYDEWLGYYLLWLEFEHKEYMKRFKGEPND